MPDRFPLALAVLAWALSHTGVRAATDDSPAGPPAYQIAWKFETPDAGRDHVWLTAKFLPEFHQLVAIEKAFDGEANRDGQYFLWRFTADGSVQRKTRIDERSSETPAYPTFNDVKGIFALPGGQLLVVGDLDGVERDVELIRLNAQGERLPEQSRGKVPRYLCEAVTLKSDSSLLVVGTNTPLGAVAGETDLQGNIVWKQEYPGATKLSRMNAAVFDPASKSILLAGQSGEWNKFGVGTASVWLLRCDEHGTLLDQRTFPGHLLAATGLPGGKLALFHGKRSWLEYQLDPAEPVRPTCSVIASDLKTIRETTVDFISPPVMESAGNDRFVVAGYSRLFGHKLHVDQYNAAGELTRRLVEPLEIPRKDGIFWLDAAAEGQRACVAITMYHVDGKHQIRRGVLYGLSPARD